MRTDTQYDNKAGLWMIIHHHHHHHRLYSLGWALALASAWGFVTIFFLQCEVVSLTPNPQPGGPGYPFLSGSSSLTCLAWEARPVAYVTASITLGIIWPHKPQHCAKVGIPSGGLLEVWLRIIREKSVPLMCVWTGFVYTRWAKSRYTVYSM